MKIHDTWSFFSILVISRSTSIATNILLGDLFSCYASLRLIVEYAVTCFYACKKGIKPSREFFERVTGRFKKVYEYTKKEVGKFPKGLNPTKLRGKLSEMIHLTATEWKKKHKKGFPNDIPGYLLGIPSKYCSDIDVKELRKLEKYIQKVRKLIKFLTSKLQQL